MIDENSYSGKPELRWIDAFVRKDGSFVDGHWRTVANETIADNLNTDVDDDGIPGFFDADADGDELLEAIDLDGNGVVDMFQDLLDNIF